MTPCHRCSAIGCPWDYLGAHCLCPDCLEKLAIGEAEPLSLAPNPDRRCAVCRVYGTVPYLTHPLHGKQPLTLDFCGEHLRDFVGRRLTRTAFRLLRRRLGGLGLGVTQIFLLHQAFYDEAGRAVNPAGDREESSD